jgi:hypothetical protein
MTISLPCLNYYGSDWAEQAEDRIPQTSGVFGKGITTVPERIFDTRHFTGPVFVGVAGRNLSAED